MKRFVSVVFALLLSAVAAFGANKYVDGSCSNNGDGTTSACAGSPGGIGAWNSVANGAAAVTCGNTINIKVSTYNGNNTTFSNACASGTPLIVQGNGWTAVGAATQDVVYLENVGKVGNAHLVAGDWTECVWDGSACDCDAANQNVQIGAGGSTACTQTWWHTKSGDGSNRVYWGVKPDGTITPRRNALAGMTAQYDANNPDGGSTILIRWGASLPAVPDVNSGNNNPLIKVSGSYITFRGLRFQANINAAFEVQAAAANITIQDNTFKYFNDSQNGSSRPLYVDSATNITVDHNEFAYSSSEPLHISTYTDGTASVPITNNWIHDIGDLTTLGNGTGGTPNCTTFTNDASSGNPTNHNAAPFDTGDFTGTIVDGNLFQNCSKRDTTNEGEYGIYLESCADNLIGRNNVISGGVSTLVTLRPHHSTPINGAVNHTSNNQFYNNIAFSLASGGNSGDGSCFALETDGNSSTTDQIFGNKFWNNTCASIIAGFLAVDTGTGTALSGGTANTIANNIFKRSTLTSPSNFIANNSQGGITLTNNLPWSGQSSGQCGTVAGVAFNCGTNGTVCGDPLFANVANNDFHIQSASPAKDAGTSTGMPVTRTRDINNTVAGSHGLPSYADNQALFGSAWDIGADEFSTGVAANLKIDKTDSPDPVVPTNNITYTLSYSNTGGTQTTGTIIADTVPTNTTFVSASNGGVLGGGGVVTWSIGVLSAGAASTVQMVVNVNSGVSNGTVISNNNYSITSNEAGPVVGITDTTTVSSLPFLTLGKSDLPDPVLAGSNIIYTIAYANTGSGGSTGVVISDTVPVNTTFVSASSGGLQSGGVVTWTIGAVNAGTNASVQMTVQVGAGVADGTIITNSTYSLASNELTTVIGAPDSTQVIAASQTLPQFIYPITQRANTWSQTQTDSFSPSSDLVQGPNGGQWIRGQASENLTLSTSGTTTDTAANLLPANSFIEAVVARVTTTITVSTNWKLGDATQTGRFTGVISGLTSGTTTVGLNQLDPTVATANLGPVQTSAAKLRVTTTGTPSAGAIRITVFYRQYIPPGS